MLVDQKAAQAELGLSAEEYIEFLGDLSTFLKTALPTITDLVHLQGDKGQIEQEAHSIKGALRNLRFIGAAESAAKLEHWAAGKVPADPDQLIKELKSRLDASFLELGLSSPL